MSLIEPLLKPLQIALNRGIAMDPDAMAKLARFDNQVVELVFQPPGISLFILLSDGGLDLLDELDGRPDARIIGSPLQLGLMGLEDSSTERLFSGAVTVEGDMQLGQQFQTFLKQIEIDWEEPVAQVFGDVAAHQLGSQLRNFGAWVRESADTFHANLSEYLREETRTLPGQFEVDRFNQAVDALRLDTDRLEARIQRLIARQQPPETKHD